MKLSAICKNWKILIIIALVISLANLAFASISTESGISITSRLDAGVRRTTINESNIDLKYSATPGTQPQALIESMVVLDLMKTVVPPDITDTRNLFNWSSLRTEVVWTSISLVLNNSNGTVDFASTIDLSKIPMVNIDKYVNITYNHIEINGTAVPELDKPSEITISNLTFENVRILKDGSDCYECAILSYSHNRVTFNAPGFTIYKAVNGSIWPAIKLSTKVNITNASMNISGTPYNSSYPSNISIDFGNDGTSEWNFTGQLNSTARIFTNFSAALNNLARGCTCNGCDLSANGLTCTIDLAIDSDSQGTIELSSLNISQVIRNTTLFVGENLALLDLDDYFYDQNFDILNYSAIGVKNISLDVDSSGIATLIPDDGFIGTNHLVIQANDSLNITKSNNITLTVIDDKAPLWYDNSSNTTALTITGDLAQFNINWTDQVELSQVLFSWNDTGDWTNSSDISVQGTRSINYSVNMTITASSGTWIHYKFFANDSSGNWNKTEESRFMVNEPPEIVINSPVDDYNTSYDNLTINWTASDTGSTRLYCSLVVDSLVYASEIQVIDGSWKNYTVLGLEEGLHNWTISCNDTRLSDDTSPRGFTVIGEPQNLTIDFDVDTGTVSINWSNSSLVDSYSIYMTDTWSDGFSVKPNITGLAAINWSDSGSGSAARYYKIEAKRGTTNKTTTITLGKLRFELDQGWNLKSIPIDISGWLLDNGTNNGSALNVKPDGCLRTLYKYNTGQQEWQALGYEEEDDIWLPVVGSENFTSLDAEDGYFFETESECNITYVGIVPTGNLTINLSQGYNLRGWYSQETPVLGDESQYGVAIPVTPSDCITYLHRYDEDADRYELTQHFAGWGWWPPPQYSGFTALEPGKGYWIETSQSCTWEHEP